MVTKSEATKTGSRRGRQQSGGTPESQGATGNATHETGSKRKVAIETVAIPARGGRLMAEEAWPFGDLPPAVKHSTGEIEGPSFFIPQDENPDAALASARKRHKGISFISRKMTGKNDADQEVDGVRVWRSPS